MIKAFIKICVMLLIFIAQVFSQTTKKDEKIYIQAKTFCIEQNWDEAITTFQSLIDDYPKSSYVDDAFFWIGYCLEKIPEMKIDAFMQYDYLVNKFPNSAWTDDAIIHQISLAEELYLDGKKQYKSFITKYIQSENNEIKNRAALALGRLKDKSVLPILENLKNDEDLGIMASNIIDYLNYGDSVAGKRDQSHISKKNLNLLYQSERTKKVKEADDSGVFSFLNTQHYEQYKAMLRKDNDWSKKELEDFALWQILDTDKFQEYFVLSNEYDQKEWLRKYWRENDPTPTTDSNEKKNEFDRRLNYARSHFSAFWNFKHMKYLPDQHLRYGWNHAPWDARGELYIKYGEPDTRTVTGWHTEEWVYFKYSVDFLVRQYMTNIYGNAIKGGELSRQRYGNNFFNGLDDSWLPELQANFIYNNEMRFEYNYKAKPIDDLEMNVNTNDSELVIDYIVPADEFSAEKGISYIEEIVIFNNDEREVTRKSFQRDVSDLENDIIQKIKIELPSGDYNFAIKIKDDNSNKLGIYKSNFRIGQ